MRVILTATRNIEPAMGILVTATRCLATALYIFPTFAKAIKQTVCFLSTSPAFLPPKASNHRTISL